MSQERIKAWTHHPVSKALLNKLKSDRTYYSDLLSTGKLLTNNDAALGKIHLFTGYITVIDSLLSLQIFNGLEIKDDD